MQRVKLGEGIAKLNDRKIKGTAPRIAAISPG
jgi:hypothetical protein